MTTGGGVHATRNARNRHRPLAGTLPKAGGDGSSTHPDGAEAAYRSAYLAAGVAMARLTQQGRIIDANPSFARLLGCSAGDLADRTFLDLIHESDESALRAGKLSRLKSGRVRADLRLKAAEGVVWARATISPARRADDAVEGLIVTLEDLSTLKAREAALEKSKLRDPGTGLANAGLLASRLSRSIATARRGGRKLALLVLEIDRFEAIEEKQGAGAGQKLLGYLAARLQDQLRPLDAVARTSGNELAVILDKVDEAEIATGVGRRLLANLEPEFYIGDAGFQVKISMGVALFPEQGLTPETLLRQARFNLYLGSRPAAKGLPGIGTGGVGPGAGTGVGSGAGGATPAAATAEPVTAAIAHAPTAESSPASEPEPPEVGEDLARRVEMLEPVSLFLSLPDRVLRRIARYMSEQSAVAGAEVSGPDSPAALRIIHEGTCEVHTEYEGSSLRLLTLGPGDFMGVDAMFSENPLPVSVRALTEVKLLVLEGEMVTRAAPPGSLFRAALQQAAGQRDSHLRALLERPHRAATSTNATQVAIYSTKGGSGRTTLALNMGAELGRKHPGEVLLVDLALPYNHLALLANLSPSTCLARIALAPEATFNALAWGAVLPHPAGFMVLPATLRPEEADLVTPDLLLRAMKVLAPQFKYIVFDLGLALDDRVLATLEMCDHVILVATPELASMHDTRHVIDLATHVLKIPAGRVHTVLNNRSADSVMSRKVVEEVLGRPLAAEFRYFGAGPELAGLEGRLQVQSDPGGHFSRSVKLILEQMTQSSPAKLRTA